jgi:hypothetical protein
LVGIDQNEAPNSGGGKILNGRTSQAPESDNHYTGSAQRALPVYAHFTERQLTLVSV